MSIRAPHQTLYRPVAKVQSYEREVFFETLGACWALSARNVSGQFAIQLHIDLTRVNLLYGIPAQQLTDTLLLDFLRTFQARNLRLNAECRHQVVHNALQMLDGMTESDFLNFSTAFQDAVGQILQHLPCWTPECMRANMALKYYGMNLIESRMESQVAKRHYAELLANYLQTTQAVFLLEHRLSPMFW